VPGEVSTSPLGAVLRSLFQNHQPEGMEHLSLAIRGKKLAPSFMLKHEGNVISRRKPGPIHRKQRDILYRSLASGVSRPRPVPLTGIRILVFRL
jgi:hypothetical protein